jgi:hypothetical protein
MQSSRLTIELVESLQQLQRKDKPLLDIVSNLQSATLPAIVEYGCLRWSRPEQFPALSDSVAKTPLARALSEVRSEVGLRRDGREKPPVRSLELRQAEFHTLQQGIDLDDDVEWLNYEQRFERAAQGVGFSNKAAANLHSALFEMAENAILHSQTPVAPLVGYQVASGLAMFVVADVGIGILASLRTNPKYVKLPNDVGAIQLALQTGVTCRRDEFGGLGFNSVFKALAEQWGKLRFRSGNGCITLDGLDLGTDKSRRHRPLPIAGFQVTVCCRATAPDGNDDVF